MSQQTLSPASKPKLPLEPYNSTLIPLDHLKRESTYYVTGVPGISNQEIAIVLLAEELVICNKTGPLFTFRLSTITDIRVVDLGRITVREPTVLGFQSSIQASAFGVEIHILYVEGLSSRISWLSSSRERAIEWDAEIRQAIKTFRDKRH